MVLVLSAWVVAKQDLVGMEATVTFGLVQRVLSIVRLELLTIPSALPVLWDQVHLLHLLS